jgi:hypothetical protein
MGTPTNLIGTDTVIILSIAMRGRPPVRQPGAGVLVGYFRELELPDLTVALSPSVAFPQLAGTNDDSRLG